MNWQEQPEVLLTLFTSMFLHGGLSHLVGNMIYLNVYGKSLEGTIGSGRFLVFYLLSGLAGGVAHVLMNASSTIPAIGASGAISGVLGAYLLLFPRATVFLMVPLLFFFPIVAFPAAFVLTWWFALQIVGGLTSAAFTQVGGGVAYWAHIGGGFGRLAADRSTLFSQAASPLPLLWRAGSALLSLQVIFRSCPYSSM